MLAVLATVALVGAIPVGPGAIDVRGQSAPTIGAGVFSVDGAANYSVVLPVGGTYYLAVATNDSMTFVDAALYYNGSLSAQENGSLAASTYVSLPPGNFTMDLAGHGRAALGWDFTNGSVQTFPATGTLLAFLRPRGPRLHVTVALGDAQRIALRIYDTRLLPAGNVTVNADTSFTVDLPSDRAQAAFLEADVHAGNAPGLYGLSWTSENIASPPVDFFAWPLSLLWITVPGVAAATVILVRRRRRRATRPRA